MDQTVSLSTNLQEIIGQMLKNIQCPICLESMKNPVSTNCNHRFCRFCINSHFQTERVLPCPLCKTAVSKRSIEDQSQLSDVIQNIKQLIDAFELDTGTKFSPVKNASNFFPSTPEPLVTKRKSSSKRKHSTEDSTRVLRSRSCSTEKATDNKSSGGGRRKTSQRVSARKKISYDEQPFSQANRQSTSNVDNEELDNVVTYPDDVACDNSQVPSSSSSINSNAFDTSRKRRSRARKNSSSGKEKRAVSQSGSKSKSGKIDKKAQEELLNYLQDGSCGAVDRSDTVEKTNLNLLEADTSPNNVCQVKRRKSDITTSHQSNSSDNGVRHQIKTNSVSVGAMEMSENECLDETPNFIPVKPVTRTYTRDMKRPFRSAKARAQEKLQETIGNYSFNFDTGGIEGFKKAEGHNVATVPSPPKNLRIGKPSNKQLDSAIHNFDRDTEMEFETALSVQPTAPTIVPTRNRILKNKIGICQPDYKKNENSGGPVFTPSQDPFQFKGETPVKEKKVQGKKSKSRKPKVPLKFCSVYQQTEEVNFAGDYVSETDDERNNEIHYQNEKRMEFGEGLTNHLDKVQNQGKPTKMEKASPANKVMNKKTISLSKSKQCSDKMDVQMTVNDNAYQKDVEMHSPADLYSGKDSCSNQLTRNVGSTDGMTLGAKESESNEGLKVVKQRIPKRTRQQFSRCVKTPKINVASLELKKMQSKISDAETHELMFSTQEARQYIQDQASVVEEESRTDVDVVTFPPKRRATSQRKKSEFFVEKSSNGVVDLQSQSSDLDKKAMTNSKCTETDVFNDDLIITENINMHDDVIAETCEEQREFSHKDGKPISEVESISLIENADAHITATVKNDTVDTHATVKKSETKKVFSLPDLTAMNIFIPMSSASSCDSTFNENISIQTKDSIVDEATKASYSTDTYHKIFINETESSEKTQSSKSDIDRVEKFVSSSNPVRGKPFNDGKDSSFQRPPIVKLSLKSKYVMEDDGDDIDTIKDVEASQSNANAILAPDTCIEYFHKQDEHNTSKLVGFTVIPETEPTASLDCEKASSEYSQGSQASNSASEMKGDRNGDAFRNIQTHNDDGMPSEEEQDLCDSQPISSTYVVTHADKEAKASDLLDFESNDSIDSLTHSGSAALPAAVSFESDAVSSIVSQSLFSVGKSLVSLKEESKFSTGNSSWSSTVPPQQTAVAGRGDNNVNTCNEGDYNVTSQSKDIANEETVQELDSTEDGQDISDYEDTECVLIVRSDDAISFKGNITLPKPTVLSGAEEDCEKETIQPYSDHLEETIESKAVNALEEKGTDRTFSDVDENVNKSYQDDVHAGDSLIEPPIRMMTLSDTESQNTESNALVMKPLNKFSPRQASKSNNILSNLLDKSNEDPKEKGSKELKAIMTKSADSKAVGKLISESENFNCEKEFVEEEEESQSILFIHCGAKSTETKNETPIQEESILPSTKVAQSSKMSSANKVMECSLESEESSKPSRKNVQIHEEKLMPLNEMEQVPMHNSISLMKVGEVQITNSSQSEELGQRKGNSFPSKESNHAQKENSRTLAEETDRGSTDNSTPLKGNSSVEMSTPMKKLELSKKKTRRGLATKSNTIHLNPLEPHPKGRLSPAAKAALALEFSKLSSIRSESGGKGQTLNEPSNDDEIEDDHFHKEVEDILKSRRKRNVSVNASCLPEESQQSNRIKETESEKKSPDKGEQLQDCLGPASPDIELSFDLGISLEEGDDDDDDDKEVAPLDHSNNSDQPNSYTKWDKRLQETPENSCQNETEHNSTSKETEREVETVEESDIEDSIVSLPCTSSPVKDKSGLNEDIEQSLIYVDDEDNDTDTDEQILPSKKKRRLQITSDSDTESEKISYSQDNATSSSALSSQSELLTTQQQEALEMDVATLQQDIAQCEAVLQGINYSGSLNNLSKALPSSAKAGPETKNDIPRYVVSTKDDAEDMDDDEENSDDDLFICASSPSPQKPQCLATIQRVPVLNNENGGAQSNFFKQFQSPGGSLHKRKTLEFTQQISSSRADDPLVKDAENKLTRDNMAASPVLLSQREKRISKLSRKVDSKMNSTRSAAGHDSISLVASGLNGHDQELLQKFRCNFRVKFNAKFVPGVTHVIVKSVDGRELVCERTLKFFLGLVHNAWILDFSWITESLGQGYIVKEDEFEICGDTCGGDYSYGPKKARLSKQPLLADYSFACVGNCNELPRDDLKDLLLASGASVVEDLIALPSSSSKHKYIIRCNELEEEPTPMEKALLSSVLQQTSVLTLNRDWILDCISAHEILPISDYLLKL